MSQQAPRAAVLVRPHYFGPNPQTNLDNTFHSWTPHHEPLAQGASLADAKRLEWAAYNASTRLAEALDDSGVTVHIFEDDSPGRPDSVFPNNWFSTHPQGQIVLYPMYAENRRTERRSDIVDFLSERYQVQEVIDLTRLELAGYYLEGTGAMVLDHLSRTAYIANSQRASQYALERFCSVLDYEPLVFDACDDNGCPIYHTNIAMSIGTEFALLATDSVPSIRQRKGLVKRLEKSGRTVLPLSREQLQNFAGNSIELAGRHGRILAMSQRAADSLTNEQISIIESSCKIVAVDIAPVELAGGSVRCMIAGVHLEERAVAQVPEQRKAANVTGGARFRDNSPGRRSPAHLKAV